MVYRKTCTVLLAFHALRLWFRFGADIEIRREKALEEAELRQVVVVLV